MTRPTASRLAQGIGVFLTERGIVPDEPFGALVDRSDDTILRVENPFEYPMARVVLIPRRLAATLEPLGGPAATPDQIVTARRTLLDIATAVVAKEKGLTQRTEAGGQGLLARAAVDGRVRAMWPELVNRAADHADIPRQYRAALAVRPEPTDGERTIAAFADLVGDSAMVDRVRGSVHRDSAALMLGDAVVAASGLADRLDDASLTEVRRRASAAVTRSFDALPYACLAKGQHGIDDIAAAAAHGARQVTETTDSEARSEQQLHDRLATAYEAYAGGLRAAAGHESELDRGPLIRTATDRLTGELDDVVDTRIATIRGRADSRSAEFTHSADLADRLRGIAETSGLNRARWDAYEFGLRPHDLRNQQRIMLGNAAKQIDQRVDKHTRDVNELADQRLLWLSPDQLRARADSYSTMASGLRADRRVAVGVNVVAPLPELATSGMGAADRASECQDLQNFQHRTRRGAIGDAVETHPSR